MGILGFVGAAGGFGIPISGICGFGVPCIGGIARFIGVPFVGRCLGEFRSLGVVGHVHIIRHLGIVG